MDVVPVTGSLDLLIAAGQHAGLGPDEIATANRRITGALTRVVEAGEASADPDGTRLLTGLGKNLRDNAMLAAWILTVAARVADPAWERFVDTFLLGLVLERRPLRDALRQELGFTPPVTVIVNPTMRCNLRCEGCYSYNLERRVDMDRELLVKVIEESWDLGVRFITVTGGEPFLYPGIEEIFVRYPDMFFMVYTNGQLLDEDRVGRLARLGNVWPAISVEGFAEETDRRRGRGVHASILAAMERLRRQGVFFGISAVPTRHNTDVLCSDEFLDHYRERGALFGWMFTYVPVGRNPDPGLMATPRQRDRLRRQTLEWRRTRPFFLADFWNDGPLCAGCLSASRNLYITPEGWAQPCTFVQFATHNVREHSLREIMDSPLFRGIRERQPYGQNLLRPCKIIDHPQVLRELVREHGARPTSVGAEQIIEDPELCAFLDRYSREYAELADRAWASESYRAGRDVLVPFYGREDLYRIFGDRLRAAERNERFRQEGGHQRREEGASDGHARR